MKIIFQPLLQTFDVFHLFYCKYSISHSFSCFALSATKNAAPFGAAFCTFLDLLKLQQGSKVLDGAAHLRNVGVLVVVPGDDLNLCHAAGQLVDHGLGSIEQGAEGCGYFDDKK